MLPIDIGIVKGETRPGPRASSMRKLSWRVPRPPIPEPIATPARSSSSFEPAREASAAASRAAATASRITRSSRRASLAGTPPRSSSPRTSPAKRTGKSVESKPWRGPIPERPATAASKLAVASTPSGETQPKPVTTTLRRGVSRSIGSVGLELLLEVGDGVAEGLELLGILLRDLDAELLLHRHHQLDDVERVRPEVVDERRLGFDVVAAHPELLDDDLRYALLQVHLASSPLKPVVPPAALPGARRPPRRSAPPRAARRPRRGSPARARDRCGARGPRARGPGRSRARASRRAGSSRGSSR